MTEQIYQAFDLLEKGDLSGALQHLDSLTIAPESEAYYDYLSTYGYVYTALKEFDKALASYHTYLIKAEQEQAVQHQHIAHHQLCMVYCEQGDCLAAMAELEKERRIIENEFPDDDLVWAVHLYEVGYVSYLMSKYDDALSAMEQSLAFALKTDDLIAQACAYRGLGEILSSPEQFSKARALFEQAGDEIGCQEIDKLLAEL